MTTVVALFAQIADPAPDGNFPGSQLMITLLGNIKWVALAACIAAALVGAGLWGWGFAQGNTVGSSRGRVFVGGGLIGAFLIAIGPALVNQLAGF